VNRTLRTYYSIINSLCVGSLERHYPVIIRVIVRKVFLFDAKGKVILPHKNCAMSPAINRRPLSAETRVYAWVSSFGICGRQSGTGAGFSPRCAALLCQFYSTVALNRDHLGNEVKRHLPSCRG
jgi:hypothetical protein